MRVRQDGATWCVLDRAGQVLSSGHATYQAAVQAIPLSAITSMSTFVREDPLARRDSLAMAEAVPAGEMPIDMPSEATYRRWTADAAFMDQWTSDNRRMTGEGRVRPFPLPLMWQTETEYGHFGAELVGWIDECTFEANGSIRMSGGFDMSDDAMEACTQLEARGCFGVSIDIGDADVAEVCLNADEDNVCCEWGGDFTEYELMGLTGTPFPAFQNARLWLDDMGAPAAVPAAPQPEVIEDAEEPDLLDYLLASAAPTLTHPPAAWFADPDIGREDHPLMTFSEQGCPLGVPLQIGDDGRVFGHVAAWGTCHIGYPDECVTAPSSPSDYAYFRTGYVVTAEGTTIPTGLLTLGTGHANRDLNAQAAAAHYDDTGTGWSRLAAGEDAIGIWVAGAVLPGIDSDVIELARATSPSGDWRPIGGNLEMIAALQVNVPGFPIPRSLAASAHVELAEIRGPSYRRAVNGEVLSLVAAGIVRRTSVQDQRDHQIAALAARVAVLETRTAPLLASAQQAVIARRKR